MRWLSARRLAITAAIVVAIAVPLVAVAASQDWWFLRFGGAPVPVTDVTIVKTGSWQGKAWQLAAYRSQTAGICFSITPSPTANPAGEGAAMGCARIEGVPRTGQSKPYTSHAIMFLSGAGPSGFPAYIVGAVIDTADEVAIELLDGTTLRTRTFDAPKELGSAIRFYATELPEQRSPTGELPRLRFPVRNLAGLSSDGRIVACLIVPVPEEGVPLAGCR